jgi:hypothetical protein
MKRTEIPARSTQRRIDFVAPHPVPRCAFLLKGLESRGYRNEDLVPSVRRVERYQVSVVPQDGGQGIDFQIRRVLRRGKRVQEMQLAGELRPEGDRTRVSAEVALPWQQIGCMGIFVVGPIVALLAAPWEFSWLIVPLLLTLTAVWLVVEWRRYRLGAQAFLATLAHSLGAPGVDAPDGVH